MTKLRDMPPGAIFWRHGQLWQLELLNDCRATISALTLRAERTFVTKEGQEVAISTTPRLNVSPDADYALYEEEA